MINRNQVLLVVITTITLSLSGFLFWSGFKQFSHPVPISVEQPSSTPQILGHDLETARVVEVIDGDTIEIESDGQRLRLRYIGIDTPETVDPRKPLQCFGEEASRENRRLLGGKIAYLQKDISETDKFGRLLRYVYLKLDDGSFLFINDYLVRQGYALASSFPPDVEYAQNFQEAQKQAQENNRGLWSKCQPG